MPWSLVEESPKTRLDLSEVNFTKISDTPKKQPAKNMPEKCADFLLIANC